MYRTDRAYYIWLVDVLRQAYMEDRLIAGSPCGCGVGNIIYAKALDMNIGTNRASNMSFDWQYSFCSMSNDSFLIVGCIASVDPYTVVRKTDKLTQICFNNSSEGIDILQLPREVLMELEWEFESTEIGSSAEEITFNRLMAAIKVLDKWFGIPPIKQEETKESFANVKHSLCTKRKEMELTT